jgi:thioredoxin-like negative regulator of GroEL
MVRDVTPSDVDIEKTKTRLLFVDCWAPWCQPCLALAPILEELDEKYKDDPEVGFLKVNTDNHREFSRENNISGIPCVLMFMDGNPAKLEIPSSEPGKSTFVDRLIGLRPIDHFEYAINALLNRQ